MNNVIDNLILEDPSLYVESFEPFSFFTETDSMSDIPSSISVPKKNVGQTILNLLKSIWEWIKKTFSVIMKFFKSLFNRKPKSVDQVLANLGVKLNEDAEDFNVDIPSSEDSDLQLEYKAKVVVKPLIVKMNNDKTITFQTKQINKDTLLHMQGKIKGNWIGNIFQIEMLSHIAVLRFIADDDRKNKLRALFEKINRRENLSPGDIPYIFSMLDQVDASNVMNESHTCTFNMLQDFHDILIFGCNVIEKLYNDPDAKKYIQEHTHALNYLAELSSQLQFGINVITNTLKSIYIIDAGYKESIHDIDTLGIFVNEMINAKVPLKYVAMNTWLLCDKTIKGNADAFKPVWGQTRVVFFPPEKNIVHKIALNAVGRVSNTQEKYVWDTLKHTPAHDLLADVYNVTKDNCVLDMRRVPGKQPNQKQCDDFVSRLNNIAKEKGIEIIDLHPGNIKHLDNMFVAIDYGLINHIRQ